MTRTSRSKLDDPATARIAWGRYKRLMRWMALVTVFVIAAALGYLRADGGVLTVTVVIATVLGVGFTMMVGTGLMLLLFLSAGTGHDEEAQAVSDDHDPGFSRDP